MQVALNAQPNPYFYDMFRFLQNVPGNSPRAAITTLSLIIELFNRFELYSIIITNSKKITSKMKPKLLLVNELLQLLNAYPNNSYLHIRKLNDQADKPID
jgi:hypothetical protein